MDGDALFDLSDLTDLSDTEDPTDLYEPSVCEEEPKAFRMLLGEEARVNARPRHTPSTTSVSKAGKGQSSGAEVAGRKHKRHRPGVQSVKKRNSIRNAESKRAKHLSLRLKQPERRPHIFEFANTTTTDLRPSALPTESSGFASKCKTKTVKDRHSDLDRGFDKWWALQSESDRAAMERPPFVQYLVTKHGYKYVEDTDG